MIIAKQIESQDLENTWLKEAITKGIKEGLTAPLLIVNPMEPEHIVRTKMIIDNFSKENYPCIPTLVIPMQIIQLVLPKEEILVSILFLSKTKGADTRVQVSLIKLINKEENETTTETTTTVHT